LRYQRSGAEPTIVAGSRSGVPILARGVNQKLPNYVHKPVVFTADRVRAYRDEIDGPGAPMDFRRHIMPFIQAEIDHTYLTLLVRETRGTPAGERFAERHAELIQAGAPTGELLRESGLPDGATLDLEALARPFTKLSFESPAHFHAALLDLMRADVAEAMRGNLDSPIKASLDVLRDIRNVIRDLVDYGGLGPASHRDEFLGWYVPINSLLSAGPPVERVKQLVALVEAGVVTIIGPRAAFSMDSARRTYVISSPDVAGARAEISVLVDARIPQPNLRNDMSPLYQQLVADGMAREFVIPGSGTQGAFNTGGLEVTPAPYHVIDRSGEAVPGLYALGLPTEHLRWFNQIGNGRPGLRTLFHRDADSIAESILNSVPIVAPGDTRIAA
jgi:methylaspartate mutase epsilon subunit